MGIAGAVQAATGESLVEAMGGKITQQAHLKPPNVSQKTHTAETQQIIGAIMMLHAHLAEHKQPQEKFATLLGQLLMVTAITIQVGQQPVLPVESARTKLNVRTKTATQMAP